MPNCQLGPRNLDGSTYFAGFPPELVSPISCPDNVAFDASGNAVPTTFTFHKHWKHNAKQQS